VTAVIAIIQRKKEDRAKIMVGHGKLTRNLNKKNQFSSLVARLA